MNRNLNALCSSCPYWKPYSGLRVGTCRASLPMVDDDGDGMWPSTFDDDFCRGHPGLFSFDGLATQEGFAHDESDTNTSEA